MPPEPVAPTKPVAPTRPIPPVPTPPPEELFAAVKKEYEEAVSKAAEEKRKEEGAERARREAEGARKAKLASRGVNRTNYNKIRNGMSLDEVQDILGPGKEVARAPGVLVVTWESKPEFLQQPTIISITFENNRVEAKAIIGP